MLNSKEITINKVIIIKVQSIISIPFFKNEIKPNSKKIPRWIIIKYLILLRNDDE